MCKQTKNTLLSYSCAQNSTVLGGILVNLAKQNYVLLIWWLKKVFNYPKIDTSARTHLCGPSPMKAIRASGSLSMTLFQE